MTGKRDPILEEVISWAQGEETVRAAVMTGSRGEPSGRVDKYSDYDIRLWVADSRAFIGSDEWLGNFGTVMIVWPRKPFRTAGFEGLTRLVRYKEGHRIDFQIEDADRADMDELDNGYRVLLDKNGLTGDLPVPTHSRYSIRKPSEEEYLDTVNAFWWDALYVPKCLAREQLPYASYMLECQLRHRLLKRMMEWHIGSRNDWSLSSGVHGRHFREHLDQETWDGYLSTFPSGGIEDHWRSFFAMLLLFRKMAVMVGEVLGYAYPIQTDEEASEYCMEIFQER